MEVGVSGGILEWGSVLFDTLFLQLAPFSDVDGPTPPYFVQVFFIIVPNWPSIFTCWPQISKWRGQIGPYFGNPRISSVFVVFQASY